MCYFLSMCCIVVDIYISLLFIVKFVFLYKVPEWILYGAKQNEIFYEKRNPWMYFTITEPFEKYEVQSLNNAAHS